ncbi:MAG: hypothetical protein ABIW76_07410 [Fibrobacteria bacterium]
MPLPTTHSSSTSRSSRHSALACACLAASLMSCLGTNDSGGSGKTAAGKSAIINLIPVMEPTQNRALARRVGGGTAEGLESFQVAIEAVFMARDITITGSAWSNPQGFLGFYRAEDLMTEGHNVITGANALDAANDRFYVDFMTAAGRERIANTATYTEAELGEYNFVIVNWAQPFRVRGSVDLGDGRKVYTKAGSYDAARGATVTASDMLTGPAETSVAVKNNGGAWFRLLRPLVLTAADLDTTKLVHDTTRLDSAGHVVDTLVPAGRLNVMLVYNPEGFLTAWDTAYASAEGPSNAEITGPGGIGNIHVPYLDATVVPFRTGEEVWRETYLFTGLFTGADPERAGYGFRTRFELYTVGDNVVAASIRGLVGAAGEAPLESNNVFFVEYGAAGTLEIQSHDHSSLIGGFHRLAAPSSAGVADLTLGHIHISACAFTLVEKRKMN